MTPAVSVVDLIVTQVACEAESWIREADLITLRAALKRVRRGCLSQKTKQRQIESRIRRLEREAAKK